ncbi:MAG: DUF956 family protein, partial [Oenococcus oeni]
MVESINRKIDLVVQATSYMGLGEYGEIMIGDEGFEFFSDRDPRKFIQIPWKEVNLVVASLIFKGKWIPRYAIQTKHNGMFKFSSKHPKEVLRMVRKYIDPDHIVRSLTFFQVMRRNFKWLFMSL